MFEYLGDKAAVAHRYAQTDIAHVGGWFGGEQIHLVNTINRIQKAQGTTGNMLEIGVHEGRFFCFWQHLMNEGEAAFAVDIFEDQDLNQELSGNGSLSKFLDNVRTYGAGEKDVVVVKSESTRVSLSGLAAEGRGDRFRFVHVDGSHVANVVASDMALASSLIGPGGCVMVDDYQVPGWPGVSEGVARYLLLNPTAGLAPVCVAFGKGIFVRKTEQRQMLALFLEHLPFTERWVRSHYDSEVVVL